MKKRNLVGSGVLLAIAGVVGIAATAGASEPTGTISRDTTSYSTPSNTSVPVRSLAQGSPVDAVCFTEGQNLDGNHLWFRIMDENGSSYVHRSAIGITQGADLRHCPTG